MALPFEVGVARLDRSDIISFVDYETQDKDFGKHKYSRNTSEVPRSNAILSALLRHNKLIKLRVPTLLNYSFWNPLQRAGFFLILTASPNC